MRGWERFARAVITVIGGIAVVVVSLQSFGARPFILVLGFGAILLACVNAALLFTRMTDIRRNRLGFEALIGLMVLAMAVAASELALSSGEAAHSVIFIGFSGLLTWALYENLRRFPRGAVKVRKPHTK
jgi:uncharacterized membrane protein